MTIISNKTPSIKSKRLDISKPKFAFNTIFPSKINIGNNNGIVINAPSTDPLFKLSEFPRANKFIKIYEEINNDGKATLNEFKFSDMLIEKKVPSNEMGIPMSSQCIRILMKIIENNELSDTQ